MKKKTVIITGGAKGIGYACAKMFSSENYNVVIIDNDILALNSLNQFKVDKYYCDVSNYEELKKCCYFIVNRYKQVDVVINNAGIQVCESFNNYDYNKWKRIMDTNYFGTCNVISVFSDFMISGSTILNMLSVHSFRPRMNKYAYDSSKSAIEMFTKELALEFAARGITVNGLSFGAVETDMNKVWEYEGSYRKEALSKVPLRIIFKPCDIASFAYNIINNFALYTTGSVFVIDGGRSLI